MISARWIYLIAVSLIVSSLNINGMIYDNRYFALLDKPVRRQDTEKFFFRVQPFVMFAHEASLREDEFEDDESTLFDIEGPLHYGKLHDSLGLAQTLARPLARPDLMLRGRDMWWSQPGRLDSAGLAFRWYWALSRHWEIGGSALLMGARSRFSTLLRSHADILLTEGDRRDIQASHEEFMRLNGIDSFLWSKFGVGDLDGYIRLGTLKHYFLKCKTIDAGIKLGIIAPTGVRRELRNPASLPFGGNGHWGVYGDVAVDTELKDDLFAGFNVRFIQRLAHTETVRLPLRAQTIPSGQGSEQAEQEPDLDLKSMPLSFAPSIDRARIRPGWTFVFSPYVGFGDLREGFGVQVGYTLISHAHDRIVAHRNFESPKIDRELFKHRSEWNREYVTVSLMYDLAKNRECRGRAPLLSFDVDIPVDIVASKQSFRTYAVSLRIEWSV